MRCAAEDPPRGYRHDVDEDTNPTGEPAPQPVVCARCGVAAEGGTPPLAWLSSVEDGRLLHFCESCARLHIRAIESRLDSLWW